MRIHAQLDIETIYSIERKEDIIEKEKERELEKNGERESGVEEDREQDKQASDLCKEEEWIG